MVTSDVQLCNMALSRIGSEERIQKLSDTTKNEAVQCNLFYAQTRDEVLRAFPWPCAIHRQVLAAIDGPTLSKFTYAYQLPTDPYCLRVLGMIDVANGTYADVVGVQYEIEGRTLLTDLTPVGIKYTKQLTDTKDFDSLLAEAIILKLASKIAYPIADSTTLEQDMLQQYLVQLNIAKDVAGTERKSKKLKPTMWVNKGGYVDRGHSL